MSIISQLNELAKVFNKNLRSDDIRFRRCVYLIHLDGTTQFYKNAFLMSWENEYIIVFTEHHGFRVYHKEDLEVYHELEFREESIVQFI